MADAKTEKQKVQEITEKLEQGIKELFESEKYKTYLNTMSKFHNYSFNNTMLIAMQKPDATLVAGFKAWQKNFDRHVKKGEKGIRILAPAPYKIKEEQEKLDPVTGEIMLDKNGMPITEEVEIKIPAFRVVPVFDVSQTDGKELPDIGVNELSGSVEDYEDFMQALTEVSPVPLELKNKVAEFISDIVSKTGEYATSLLDKFKSNLIAIFGFIFSVILANIVSDQPLNNLFTREITVLVECVLAGSFVYLFICYFQSRYEIEKVYESYEQLKLNYKDILTEDDLLETFGNDEGLNKMKKTISKSEKLYLGVWIVFLIAALLIVEYLSSNPTYEVIGKELDLFMQNIKKMF